MHSRRNEYYVTLDVGGTSIKAALLNGEYDIVENSFSIEPIDSNGPSGQVIDVITSVVEEKFCTGREVGEIRGIGLCFPELSDYKSGTIAIIKEKFRNSSGVKLRDEIIKRLGLPLNFHIVFEEDSVAFLMGAVRVGKVKDFKRILGLTLGTGLGSAFMVDGRIVRNAVGVPPDGELGYLPYNDGVIEDIISSRGIIDGYRRYAGHLEKDVKCIALLATKGDANAIRAFEEFGKRMGQILRQFVEDFEAECFILGGQIAKSTELFIVPLKKELSGIASLKRVMQAESIDLCPFYGLLSMLCRR